MYEHKGIGLAANQVDLPYRFFIINVSGEAANKDQEHVLINPTILRQSGNVETDEGCLSFPEIYAPVRRSEHVVVVAYDLAGNENATRLTACSRGHCNTRTTISTARCSSTASAPATWRTSARICWSWRPNTTALANVARFPTTSKSPPGWPSWKG